MSTHNWLSWAVTLTATLCLAALVPLPQAAAGASARASDARGAAGLTGADAGSIGQVNPTTGRYIWRTGLPCSVEGTPTLDSAGVLAVGTYSCPKPATPGAYLIRASTGTVLKSLPVGSAKVFGQMVFAQGALFVATDKNGLYDFMP